MECPPNCRICDQQGYDKCPQVQEKKQTKKKEVNNKKVIVRYAK